jgi:hypothetical protein
MVRSPTDSYCSRHPNLAIFGIVAPLSVVVEIFVAHHLRRDISRRARPLVTMVPFLTPVVKVVAITPVELVDICIESIAASQ